jgi:hypothetical protein
MSKTQQSIDKKLAAQQQLNRVIKALERVDPEINKAVYELSNGMSEMEIVQTFNQHTLDSFNSLINITKKMGKESIYKISGYKTFFENALKINAMLPIDKFTLIILEFAPEIYDENEEVFLKMTIPDAQIEVSNEFGFIRSELFKQLWLSLNKTDKDSVKDNIILLVTYAQAHLYKTLMKKK